MPESVIKERGGREYRYIKFDRDYKVVDIVGGV